MSEKLSWGEILERIENLEKRLDKIAEPTKLDEKGRVLITIIKEAKDFDDFCTKIKEVTQ